jgi:hypothetical protein
MEFDKEKFKDLVHYICHTAHRDELGATKLNKVLWYADTISYLRFKKPITGESYKKEKLGPVPVDILEVLGELKQSNKLVIREVDYHGLLKREYITLTDPDLHRFTADEISLVDAMIQVICHNHTATSISDLSHNVIWELATIGEQIPYHAVLAARLGEINEGDLCWAKESIAEDEAA